MKVALLGPIAWRTPPLHYGPWELITSLLAEGLTARGVDVTLFATLDSVTKATLDGVCPTGYEESAGASTAGSGRRCTSRTRWPAPASSTWCTTTWTGCRWRSPQHCAAPLLTTIHGFSGREHPAGLPRGPGRTTSSISDSDRSPDLDYVGHRATTASTWTGCRSTRTAGTT